MPLDAKLTSPVYTGPLKVNVGDGVTEQEGRSLLHVARVMMGKALQAADAVGQKTTSAWHTFENGVTVRVARIGGLCIADFVRHPVADMAEPEKYSAFALRPYGGVVLGGYYEQEEVEFSSPTDGGSGSLYSAGTTGDKFKISLNNSFAPSPNTLTRLDRRYKALERLLAATTDNATRQRLTTEMKYTHQLGDAGFKRVTYLALRVPDQWKSMYNNPVQQAPGSTTKPKVYAEHRLIKPTMFTGRMRVVAQIIMGMGTQSPPDHEQQKQAHPQFDSCYEDYIHDKEDVVKDDKYLGSIDYWFHWWQTHGVYKTDGGRYYLIQISSDGVWAMRLPVLPMSNWALPDDAKNYLADLPLGYDFPTKWLTKAEMAAGVTKTPWDRAVEQGWVKQILPASALNEFYSELQPTYPECGWAFSMSGKKADNVGWRINAPRPHDYPVFEHWSIQITGGDANGGSGDDNPKRYDYSHDANGYDRSISDLKASVTKVGQGSAVDIASAHKPFKVPEIDQETGTPGVVSFNMNPRGFPDQWTTLPEDYRKAIATYPDCDTVVHVFYDDEELVWVKFFNPIQSAKPESDSWDDRDDMPYCMMLGGYSWGNYSRSSALPKGFYSNRVDPRKHADEDRTDMRSTGRKTWESPYMGIAYSWPYPPFHFGYAESNREGEWFNDFNPSYASVTGSPWAGKRHFYHIHVTGERVTGQRYSYACAIPFTDREATFICERHSSATRDKIDYQYAASVMQFVYYVYPSWIPDYELGVDHGIIPVGNWEWWQMRYDTVKYLAWMYFGPDRDYTKEIRQPIQTTLDIVGGTHTAPLDLFDRSKHELAVEEYKVYTLCSKLGGEYPKEMKAEGSASEVWEAKIPSDDGNVRIAFLWCTRSVIGAQAAKQHIVLDGKMEYTGALADKMNDYDKTSPHRQVTFIGET